MPWRKCPQVRSKAPSIHSLFLSQIIIEQRQCPKWAPAYCPTHCILSYNMNSVYGRWVWFDLGQTICTHRHNHLKIYETSPNCSLTQRHFVPSAPVQHRHTFNASANTAAYSILLLPSGLVSLFYLQMPFGHLCRTDKIPQRREFTIPVDRKKVKPRWERP